MKFGTNGVEMAQYGPISGQDEAQHLQEPLQTPPGPLGPPKKLKNPDFRENPDNPGIPYIPYIPYYSRSGGRVIINRRWGLIYGIYGLCGISGFSGFSRNFWNLYRNSLSTPRLG